MVSLNVIVYSISGLTVMVSQNINLKYLKNCHLVSWKYIGLCDHNSIWMFA